MNRLWMLMDLEWKGNSFVTVAHEKIAANHPFTEHPRRVVEQPRERCCIHGTGEDPL